MAINPVELRNALIQAAKRHDDFFAVYQRVVNDLFQEIAQAIRELQGKTRIFEGRTESSQGVRAFVLKNRLTNKGHLVGKSVLTFQTLGLDYHPTDGRLCGAVDVIWSDEDYWAILRRAKVPIVQSIAASVISRELASALHKQKRHQLESIENITRESIATLWTSADEPGRWFLVDPEGMEESLVVRDYLYRILDLVYNPEYKIKASKSEE